jgi:hypothetical protein
MRYSEYFVEPLLPTSLPLLLPSPAPLRAERIRERLKYLQDRQKAQKSKIPQHGWATAQLLIGLNVNANKFRVAVPRS